MSEPLYKIAADYAEAAARLAETDLDDQTIADTLEGLAGDLRDKAIAVASVIRNMEADAKSHSRGDLRHGITANADRNSHGRPARIPADDSAKQRTFARSNVRGLPCRSRKTRHGLLSTTNRYCQQR